MRGLRYARKRSKSPYTYAKVVIKMKITPRSNGRFGSIQSIEANNERYDPKPKTEESEVS